MEKTKPIIYPPFGTDRLDVNTMPDKDSKTLPGEKPSETTAELQQKNITGTFIKGDAIETGIVSQRELSRELGFKEALSIGLGGTIGGGVFSVLGLVANIAGPAAIISFALGGVIGMLIGYSYSKLALAFPSAGGSFTFCKAAFGKYFGGYFGWLLWIAYLASCSLYAYTFGVYFADLILTESSPVWLHNYLKLFLAFVIILLSTIINIVGVKETGKSQNIIVLIKVIILAVFIAIMFPSAIKNASTNLVPFFPDAEGNSNPLMGLGLAVVGTSILFVAFEGVELIPNATEEIQEPQKNIPRSIYVTVISSTIIYLLVVFTALAGTNYKVFTEGDAETALATAAEGVIGLAGKLIIIVGALFSTASAFNASLYGSSRLGFVMSRERIFPSFFKRVSKKNRVPIVSILTISAITTIMTFTLKLEEIAGLASTIFLLLFAAVSLSSLVLRKKTKANLIVPLLGFLGSLACFILYLWQLVSGVVQGFAEGLPVSEIRGFLTLILLPSILVVVAIGSYVTIRLQDPERKRKVEQ